MIPKEAAWLIDWTATATISYGDFLRAKQFEHSIRFAIDEQTKQLVGSNKQLLARGFTQVGEKLENGFSVLSADLNAVEDAFRDGAREFVSTLEWGFGAALMRLDRVNANLAELIALAKTPSQKWAYEQFEIARDEHRRGLYPEALESVTRAINGHGSNVGYKTEFRFHALLGTLRLGSWLGNHPNSSEEVVDLTAAEAAFLAAARYSESDYPVEAGKFLICAGRAAFLQREVPRAIEATSKGLALCPGDPEGEYQLAKFHCAQGTSNIASKHLLNALMLQPDFAIRASSEPDFLSHRDMLDGTIILATKTYKERYRKVREQADRALSRARQFNFDGVPLEQLVSDEIVVCDRILRDSDSLQSQNNLLGAFAAARKLREIWGVLDQLFPMFKARIAKQMRQRAYEMAESYKPISDGSDVIGIFGILFWILIMAVGVPTRDGVRNGRTLEAILDVVGLAIAAGISLFVVYVVLLVVFAPIQIAINASRQREESEIRSQIEASISALENTPDPQFSNAVVTESA